MQVEKRSIKKHLFVCCNTKAVGDGCGAKNSKSLVDEIKLKLRENDLWDEYKVTASGCLGPCSQGISATLYPDNLLLTEITQSDTQELYTLLTGLES